MSSSNNLNEEAAKLIDIFEYSHLNFKEGVKSTQGRGGMSAKVAAALKAAQKGVSVIIANGNDALVINKILNGEQIGTLFLPSLLAVQSVDISV